MTAGADAIGRTAIHPASNRAAAGWFIRFLERNFQFALYEDVVAIILMGGILATVGWSVQLARWGNSPFMHATLLLAGVAGLLFARWRPHWLLGHLLAVAGGFAVVFWQAAYRTEGDNIIERTRDVWERFFAWLEAANTGGTSTDLVPFTVMLLSVAWIVGYLASWSVFRWRSPWVATVLLGSALLINLSYRPGLYEYTLFLFVGISMLLFAHLAHVRRTRRWRSTGTRYPPETRLLSVQDGFFLTSAIVLIAVVIPLVEPRSRLLTETVGRALRAPSARLEEPAKRLLSGVSGRPRVLLRDFGHNLPFLGAFELADNTAMSIETEYPAMSPGRIYDIYTSSGWKNSPLLELDIPRGGVIEPSEQYLERIVVSQRVQPGFNTVSAISASGIVGASQKLRVMTPMPVEWVWRPGINEPPRDAPDEVVEFARNIVTTPITAGRTATAAEQELRSRLPPSLVLNSIRMDGERLTEVNVGRAGALILDPIAVDLPGGVMAGSTYTANLSMSRASDEQLAESGDDYPAWVTDRYLQLPETLPGRVRDLAARIAKHSGAETPWEKTVAISGYLQSLSYSEMIRGPAAGVQDGIDYFLFDTRFEPCPAGTRLGANCEDNAPKGYSQYFGSALAVMLRSVGVPARMVAGYAVGEYIPEEKRFLIRDTDRHGWAQVYFPGYGWIDIEATPGYPAVGRGVTVDEFARRTNSPVPFPFSEFEQGFVDDVSEFEALARLNAQRRLAQAAEPPESSVRWVAVPIAGLAAVLLALAVAWNFGMGRLAPAQRAYVKMNRLGWLAGARRRQGQTSAEYGRALDALLPRSQGAAEAIAHRYNAYLYAPRPPVEHDSQEVEGLWRMVRSALVRRAARRILPTA